MSKHVKNTSQKNTSKKTGKDMFNAVALIIIIISAILAYSNSFDCSFQLDDRNNIVENMKIRELSKSLKMDDLSNLTDRPLAIFSFALNYKISELNVVSYHIFNLLVHIISGIIVFFLLTSILKILEIQERESKLFALFGALLFILHPIQTQAVTYIVQRMASMSAMFYLLSVWCYLTARLKHNAEGKAPMAFYFVALLSGIAAVLTKQNAATFPVAWLLIESFFIKPKVQSGKRMLLFASYLLIILIFIAGLITDVFPRETKLISRTDYFLTQTVVLMKYIQLLFLPFGQNLDYDFSVSQGIGLTEIAGFAFLAALVFIAYWFMKHNKLISFGIIWFLVTLAVESSVIPIQDVIFEHRLYLPFLGFSLFFVSILINIKKKIGEKNLRLAVAFLMIILAILTFSRNNVWKTTESLWTDVMQKSPEKARPYIHLANLASSKGEVDKAIDLYEKAEKRNPKFEDKFTLYYTLGNLYYGKQKYNESIAMYLKTLKVKPDYLQARVNMANVYNILNKYSQAIEILSAFKDNSISFNEKHIAFNVLATAYYKLNEKDTAAKYFQKAVEFKPDFLEALNNLSICLLEIKDTSRAIEYYKKSAALGSKAAQDFLAKNKKQ